MTEIIYKPSEVMEKLNLKESVYKKYVLALEKEGYVFQRNEKNHRFFTDKDIQMLENFMELIKYDGMTIEAVAKKIGSMDKKEGHDSMPVEEKQGYDVMTLVEMAVSTALEKQEQNFSQVLKEQNEFNKLLLEKITSQEQYIKESLEKRDKQLVESLRRTVQEERQQEKQTMLETASTKEQNKSTFFSRLFGKK